MINLGCIKLSYLPEFLCLFMLSGWGRHLDLCCWVQQFNQLWFWEVQYQPTWFMAADKSTHWEIKSQVYNCIYLIKLMFICDFKAFMAVKLINTFCFDKFYFWCLTSCRNTLCLGQIKMYTHIFCHSDDGIKLVFTPQLLQTFCLDGTSIRRRLSGSPECLYFWVQKD